MKVRIFLTGTFLLLTAATAPPGFSLAPVENSAEDVYWSSPMTVHDYEKDTDLHNIALSAVSLTELEIFRIVDGIINFTVRSNQSPISRSLDSLEYAYSRLPQVRPVRRFGQLWNALQIRQLSLSDGRLALSATLIDSYGVTSMIQVRANRTVIFVEDVIHDLDSLLMSPFNWGISSLRDRPVKLQTLGYAAEGLGLLRRGLFGALRVIDNELARFGSDVLFGIKKAQDGLIRRKRIKKHGHLHVYAKMPASVYQEHRSFFEKKGDAIAVDVIDAWRKKTLQYPDLLPDDVEGPAFTDRIVLPADLSDETLIEADYSVWEKAPRELKKYVITADEFKSLVRQYPPPD